MILSSFTVSRRTILAGFAGAAATALLAACGGGEATSTPSRATAAGATVPPPAAAVTTVPAPAASVPAMVGNPARKVAIEYWHINTDRLGGPAVREVAKNFNDATPGIALTEKVYPDYATILMALQAAQAAKIQPAVAQIGYGYLRYVAGNLPHVTIDELARRDTAGKGTEWLAQHFTPAVLNWGAWTECSRGCPTG